MIPAEIIRAKRNGKSIPSDILKDFISGYVTGIIPDYQMSAFLMATFFNGMSDDEIFSFTDIMLNSGEKMDFDHLDSYTADKHSTGGVGDKVSIILGPLLAACGLSIPMLSGRSLGHTGGTLDKLETIPGFQVDVSLDKFRELVESVGIAMIGQTKEICPADRKMYALRDVTGTVESIPLICGSIMSKKIAEGIQGLVLDVKTGNGAFMSDFKDAKKLGTMLQKIGLAFNVNTDVVYSSMNQPLGNTAGLWCEVVESIDGLLGKGPEDTMIITYQLGVKLLLQAKLADDENEAVQILKSNIVSGKAYSKFIEMVEAQGGQEKDITDYKTLYQPENTKEIKARRSGIIQSMDTLKIGLATIELGCGRKKTSDSVDPTSGIKFHTKVGDKVNPGDTIFEVFNSNQTKLENAVRMLETVITISDRDIHHQLILEL